MSQSISLRSFGYSMSDSNESRYQALRKAIDTHGFGIVVSRLIQIKINVKYLKQTEGDIMYVLTKIPVRPQPRSNTMMIMSLVFWCMLLSCIMTAATMSSLCGGEQIIQGLSWSGLSSFNPK